jgi:import inner membrane translocase subunit TIM10
MSFLGFGGRPQPTSAEKIAAVETELRVVAEMHSRYVLPSQATKTT